MSSWKLGPCFPSWIQSQKNLEYLDMSNVGISDSIPTGFWETSSSSYLNFSHNHIHGKLPKALKVQEFFQIVDLSSNHLYGNLPCVGANVIWLDLSHNSFSGTITDFLCQKSDNPNWLQVLKLASNNLSGRIPNCWRMWPELVEVNLESNCFIGSLPSSMGSLSNLQQLRIRNNTHSGKFPASLKRNRKLISLDLGENNLTGDIPAWVGERLTNLKFLRLRSNHLSGNIPNTICGMESLQDLDLARNKLSGNIPNCLNHLSAMINKVGEISETLSSVFMNNAIISMVLWVKDALVRHRPYHCLCLVFASSTSPASSPETTARAATLRLKFAVRLSPGSTLCSVFNPFLTFRFLTAATVAFNSLQRFQRHRNHRQTRPDAPPRAT
ncbi:hypothetical protein AHAS_Ahas06G0261200 [Arachis hypogaea]